MHHIAERTERIGTLTVTDAAKNALHNITGPSGAIIVDIIVAITSILRLCIDEQALHKRAGCRLRQIQMLLHHTGVLAPIFVERHIEIISGKDVYGFARNKTVHEVWRIKIENTIVEHYIPLSVTHAQSCVAVQLIYFRTWITGDEAHAYRIEIERHLRQHGSRHRPAKAHKHQKRHQYVFNQSSHHKIICKITTLRPNIDNIGKNSAKNFTDLAMSKFLRYIAIQKMRDYGRTVLRCHRFS